MKKLIEYLGRMSLNEEYRLIGILDKLSCNLHHPHSPRLTDKYTKIELLYQNMHECHSDMNTIYICYFSSNRLNLRYLYELFSSILKLRKLLRASYEQV